MKLTLGKRLEAEIREQPAVWRRLAESTLAGDLADAIRERDVVLVGSGSSLFVAMLGGLALRRRTVRAVALAASEASFDRNAYRDSVVVALSQSGRSRDVFDALESLHPTRLVALTNDGGSPLAQRADVVIDVAAGREQAVPATKSVTAMAAVVLWAAASLGGVSDRGPATLRKTADDVDAWLVSEAIETVCAAASEISHRRSLVIAGAGYATPIAYELALKVKESSYLHAEGFAAGEFRHGSAALLDGSSAILGIVDEASRAIVRRPLDEAAQTGSLRYTIGADVDDIPRLGPIAGEAFNTLAWLVSGQMLALEIGRARGVDSDLPRGLTKFVV